MLPKLIRPSFPPYHLGSEPYVKQAQEKFARLEKLYYMGQNKNWNGKEVLAELLARHGGVQIAPEKRGPLARVFSIILWGELAAWIISADLAERVDDVEARMAATGQAFDEARHFTTMRAYLMELGGEIPPLDAYSAILLRMLISERSLLHKLLGMQLLVETIAVDLFRTVAEARLEPVLSDLLPYFERDESRHVGLGVIYLPEQLSGLSLLGTIRLQAFQARVISMLTLTSSLLSADLETLGIDNNLISRRGLRLQQDALAQMSETRGVLKMSAPVEWLFSQALDFLFPPSGQKRSTVAEGITVGTRFLASAGNYALSFVA